MTVFFSILVVVAVCLAAGAGGMVFDFHSSDAAGQGMTRAFAVIVSILLWLALGGIVILCCVRSSFNGIAAFLAVILYLALAVAHFEALNTLSAMERRDQYETLLRIVTVAGPFLIILCCGWNFVRPAGPVNAIFALAVATLAVIPWPVRGPIHATIAARRESRQKAYDDSQALLKAKIEEIDSLPAGSPLDAFLKYTGDFETRQSAVRRMKDLPNRQAEAEKLLAGRDTRLIPVLPDVELEMNPRLCDGGRESLRKLAEEWKPATQTATFDSVHSKFDSYLQGFSWLLDKGCECKAEIAALEQSVRLYPDTFDKKLFVDYLLHLQAKPRSP